MLLRTLSLSSLALLSSCLLAFALASGWLATGLVEPTGVDSSLVAVFFVLPAALIWCLQGGSPLKYCTCHFGDRFWLQKTVLCWGKVVKCKSEHKSIYFRVSHKSMNALRWKHCVWDLLLTVSASCIQQCVQVVCQPSETPCPLPLPVHHLYPQRTQRDSDWRWTAWPLCA